MDAGWAGEVAHEIRLGHPVRYKSKPGGGFIVYLECSTCPQPIEWHIPKKYPSDVIRKKLNQQGWDLRKRRCPACVKSGRKTPHGRKPPDVPDALSQEINRVFGNKSIIEPLPQIEIGEHMDAKIGINDRNLSFTVPSDSKFFEAFVNKENFRPKAFWSVDFVQDSPTGEPLVRIHRTKPPAGKVKAPGMAQGSYDPKNAIFTMMIKRSALSGVDSLGFFRLTKARLVRQDENSYYFRLPEDRKGPILRGKDRDVRLSGAEMMRSIHNEDVPSQIEAPLENNTPSPELSPEPKVEAEKEQKTVKVSLRQAINAVNLWKDHYGSSMELIVTSSGHLKAMVEYGPDD